MRRTLAAGKGWSRGDFLVAGGAVIATAASADLVWTVNDRFSLDLAELSALDRAAAALWDLRPLPAAVFALGALLVLRGVAERPRRLAPVREPARAAVAALAAAIVALAVVVVVLAAWVAAAGAIGGRDELGFVYTGRERAVTLATQAVAWIPLGVLLALVARQASRRARPHEARDEAAEPPRTGHARLSEEMEELWRERLAFSSKREQARMLLGRIQALERAGEYAEARKLAEEMRRL